MKRAHLWILGAIVLGALAGWGLNAATIPVTVVRFDDAAQAAPGVEVRRVDGKTFEATITGRDPGSVVGGKWRIVSRTRDWPEQPRLRSVAAQTLHLLGRLYMKMLLMLMVPLIVASMVSGVCGIGDVRSLGRVGGRTALFYGMTVAIAVATGLILVNLIRPGSAGNFPTFELPDKFRRAPLTVPDLILMAVPENIFRSMADGEVLPLITFSLVLGGVIAAMREAGAPLRACFDSLFEAMTRITGLVLYFAPVGTFALVAMLVWESGFSEFARLGLYVLTVLAGLAVHFAVLTACTAWLGGRNPIAYIRAMAPALMTAFSTASSNATIPVSMECVEKRAGIPRRIAAFVLPVGATANMDGTALYEAVAAMFIAQAFGIPMGLGQQVIIFVVATVAAIGAAGIPGAGTVTMVIVLRSVGLPIEGIALILAVDRFLDMCRTTVNVYGDLVASAVVARAEGVVPEPPASRAGG
ncbi:MAG: dicarboxylate/amino acid:cation symporter [Candidatus Brocadiae bacterium]|nr:dicarboxylate/amino acid:cation symporter [Candidatus Brocadiia bacterium]